MRITLTLDPDVVALLARIRAARNATLKEVVPEGLRRGLEQMAERARPAERFQTEAVSLGRCLVGDLDDGAEALAKGEGEGFR